MTSELTLPTHQAVHRELEPYTELMKLLRALDNRAFIQLTKVYTDTMSKLYQRDFKFFFEEAKSRLINKRSHGSIKYYLNLLKKKLFSFFSKWNTYYIFAASTSKSKDPKAEDLISAAPICLLSGDGWTPQGDGALLDSVLECVLSQLQPVCFAEQAFCISFLQLSSVLTPSKVFKKK